MLSLYEANINVSLILQSSDTKQNLQENQDEEEEVKELLRIRSGKRSATKATLLDDMKSANATGHIDFLFLFVRKPEQNIQMGKAKKQISK